MNSLPALPDPSLPGRPGSELVRLWLSGRKPETVRGYQGDLRCYGAWAGEPDPERAVHDLLSGGAGDAHAAVFSWRSQMLEDGFAPSTVNRRLAAVRSVVKLARMMGLVSWEVEVPSVKSRAYRDTAGPGREGFLRMLEAAGDGPLGLRDQATLRLLYDLALRRAEVASVQRDDYDGERVELVGKGRLERERFTVPTPTRQALAAWLLARGDGPGGLLAKSGKQLSDKAVYRCVQRLAKAAGLGHQWPHGLRHAAITEALDLTGGDVRAVQRFSRHQKLDTLLLYDDKRRDLGGDVAERVARGS